MNYTLSKYAMVTLFFLGLSTLAATAQFLDDTIKIEEVAVVFKQDISRGAIASIEVDSLTKEQYSLGTMSDLLATHSSVNVRDYGPGNISTVSMRGTGASHTQVQWNGINLNSPLTGQADFSLIPVGFAENIVVKAGGNSLQDHSGGLGGSISISNQNNFEKGLSVSLAQEFSSFGGRAGLAKVNWGGQKWFFNSSLNYANAENDFPYWRNIPLGKEKVYQDNAATQQQGFLQEVYFRPNSKNMFSLIAWQNDSRREIPPLKTFDGGKHDEIQVDISTRAVFKWQAYGDHSSWQIQSAFVRNQLDYHLYHYTDPVSDANNRLDAADATNTSLSYLNQVNYMWSKNNRFKLNVKLTVDQHRAEVENRVAETSFTKDRNEISAFLGLYKQIHERVLLVFMGRNNLLDIDQYNFSPLGGIEFLLHKKRDWRLKANVSRNYRYASMNDLYYVPGGNPDLKAESGMSEEMSLHLPSQIGLFKFDFHLTAYASHINNWILWTPTQYGWWTPENKDKVFCRGLEPRLLIDTKIEKLTLRLNANASFSRTTNESDGEEKGEQLIYVPSQNTHADILLRYHGFSFSYLFDYMGTRNTIYGSMADYYELPAYTLHGLSLGKKIQTKKLAFGLKLQANNLFDVDYESIRQRAMPGRNYSIKLTIDF